MNTTRKCIVASINSLLNADVVTPIAKQELSRGYCSYQRYEIGVAETCANYISSAVLNILVKDYNLTTAAIVDEYDSHRESLINRFGYFADVWHNEGQNALLSVIIIEDEIFNTVIDCFGTAIGELWDAVE